MPNRIIKETIRTNKRINELTDFQFRLWLYLITYVDDFGRGSAEVDILKGFVFPRRKTVEEDDISNGLAVLIDKDLVNLYEIDGELFFCLSNWGNHQRIQTKKSKFPEPLDFIEKEQGKAALTDKDSISRIAGGIEAPNRKTNIKNDNQPYFTVTYREPPLPTVSHRLNTNPNTNMNPNTIYKTFCAEPCDSAQQQEGVVMTKNENDKPDKSLKITNKGKVALTDKDNNSQIAGDEIKTLVSLPLNTGELYPFTDKDIDYYKGLYPAIDVLQEFRSMIGWLDSNATRRKTKSGIKRFVNSWLSKAQNSAMAGRDSFAFKAKKNAFNNFEQRNTDFDSVVAMKMSKKFGSS